MRKMIVAAIAVWLAAVVIVLPSRTREVTTVNGHRIGYVFELHSSGKTLRVDIAVSDCPTGMCGDVHTFVRVWDGQRLVYSMPLPAEMRQAATALQQPPLPRCQTDDVPYFMSPPPKQRSADASQ